MGRPVVTTHSDIEQSAFALFTKHGFGHTTMDAIADAVGVSKRTIFRYYPSKNDIPWGQFDRTLGLLRSLLQQAPASTPLHVGIHRAVVDFNRFPSEAHPSHRARMRLILTTPELQAHSVLRYAEWRQVIAEHVARRTGTQPDDLAPQVAGQVSLALSLAAYEQWLTQPDPEADSLPELLDRAMKELHGYLML